MGRPLPSKYFGTGADAFAVAFHNGSAVVAGHVVKQLGSKRFRVSDGTVTKDCRLHQTASDPSTLTLGYCAFIADTVNGTELVRDITAFKLVTTSGEVGRWGTTTTPSKGHAKVHRQTGQLMGLRSRYIKWSGWKVVGD